MTPTPVTLENLRHRLSAEEIEDLRQARYGYRRDEKGEIIKADPLFYTASPEVKQFFERERLRMFGYARDLQGKIVGTLEEAVETGTQRQARVSLGGLDGVAISWTYSTGLWTVSCKGCGQPLYQEQGDYPQMRLRGEGAAMNAIREHGLACKQNRR